MISGSGVGTAWSGGDEVRVGIEVWLDFGLDIELWDSCHCLFPRITFEALAEFV